MPRKPKKPHRRVDDAVRSMLSAFSSDDSIDIVAYQVAFDEYSTAVDSLWNYRNDGTVPWRRILVLVRQACMELKDANQPEKTQCHALERVAPMLKNRFADSGDSRQVNEILRSGGFDTFALMSERNHGK